MTACKVVLSNSEGDELELGPFNQGVVFEADEHQMTLFDVASREPVAASSYKNEGWAMTWSAEGRRGVYAKLFIHGLNPWSNGSKVEILPGTVEACGGPHSRPVDVDEVELVPEERVDLGAYQSATLIPGDLGEQFTESGDAPRTAIFKLTTAFDEKFVNRTVTALLSEKAQRSLIAVFQKNLDVTAHGAGLVKALYDDWRADPDDGNAYALQIRGFAVGGVPAVTATDCFGGHTRTIPEVIWESWTKLEAPHG